jgi:hypothetical protein
MLLCSTIKKTFQRQHMDNQKPQTGNEQTKQMKLGLVLGLWGLTPLSTIFQLCRGGQIY